MDSFKCVLIFVIIICIMYYVDYGNNNKMEKQIKLMRENINKQSNELKSIKRANEVIATAKKERMMAFTDKHKEIIVRSGMPSPEPDEDEITGLNRVPMYAPIDDDTNIFLLNQINQKYNDTLAYIEPDLSNLDNEDVSYPVIENEIDEDLEDTEIPPIYNDAI